GGQQQAVPALCGRGPDVPFGGGRRWGVRRALRPPRPGGLLPLLQDDGREAGRRRPGAGRLPQGLAFGGRLQARARQRAHLDPLHRPQPRHRPAPLAGEPPEDPGEDRGRGPQVPAERGLLRDLAQLPARPGQGGPQHAPLRAAEGPRAGVLLGLHPRRDLQPYGPPLGYGQGPDAARAQKDKGLLRPGECGGTKM
ncbi:MAG: RNA polymerase ECF-type sigma factor, partial [uncultured Rubrobacteraceae bacterium]